MYETVYLFDPTAWSKAAPTDLDWRVKELLLWVEAGHYACALKELSARFGVSERHLGRLFRRHTGIKFHQYLRSARLEKASQLLLDRCQQVKDVASSVGYTDTSNFIRDFRGRFGLSPAVFRSRRFRRAQ